VTNNPTLSGTTWNTATDVLTANASGAFIGAHIVVFASNNVVNGNQGSTGYAANGGAVSTTPEPSTMAIAGLAALGFIGYGLRRRVKT
jgi:MYXO-CTERM domain-containing protein